MWATDSVLKDLYPCRFGRPADEERFTFQIMQPLVQARHFTFVILEAIVVVSHIAHKLVGTRAGIGQWFI
jgi:hypothetical protein